MSENTTDQGAQPTAPEAKQGDPADQPLGEGGKKALEAERARASELDKALKAAQAKLDEIEKAKMSDLERAQAAAKEAADKLAALERTTMRQRVALTKGVPAKWVDRLKGDTEAELAADADAILADLRPDATTPKPDLSQGGSARDHMALNGDPLERSLRDALGIA